MKKIILVSLTIALCLSVFWGCADVSGTKDESSTSLVDAGKTVINLMSEMINSEEYQQMLTPSVSSYDDVISKLRNIDYDTPSAIYEINIQTDYIFDTLGLDEQALSTTLWEYINDSAHVSLATQINAQVGPEAVAISSIFSAQLCFVNNEVVENTLYLYTYDHAYPIAVSFVIGEDGAVRAIGYFIINDSLNSAQIENIRAALPALGFRNAQIAPIDQ